MYLGQRDTYFALNFGAIKDDRNDQMDSALILTQLTTFYCPRCADNSGITNAGCLLQSLRHYLNAVADPL